MNLTDSVNQIPAASDGRSGVYSWKLLVFLNMNSSRRDVHLAACHTHNSHTSHDFYVICLVVRRGLNNSSWCRSTLTFLD